MDLLLNTMVPKCCVSFRLSTSAIKASWNSSSLKNFWWAYSSTKQQFRTERGKTELTVTKISEQRRVACDYKTFNIFFSVAHKILAFRITSPQCALEVEQSWLFSYCRSLDSPGFTDQGLIFISCTRKRDKDTEIKEAHFFLCIPG